MSIGREEVEHIAQLAKLKLSEEEKITYTHQLGQIIEYFKQLQQVNTDDVPPTTHVLPLENVLREDMVKGSLSPQEALRNAPREKRGHFAVPHVMK